MDISRMFSSFVVSFVNREGIEAAHLCAKLASRSSPECVWKEYFPPGLMGIALKDCNPAYE
jgi:hypothetical protein